MKTFNISLLAFFGFFLSCGYSDREISRKLNSKDKDDLILGAFEAGVSEDRKFIPLLLQNADDPRTSTNIGFKGFSVYQEKMVAIRKILKRNPPVELTFAPDSNIIKFYIELAN